MKHTSRLVALLLLALWLPAMLHCELEAADVHILTHDDHHGAQGPGAGSSDPHHVLKEGAVAASAPSLKILPPTDTLALVLVALAVDRVRSDEFVLSPDRHPPPPELAVGWHFVRRAAPSPRAPSVRV